MIEAETQFHNSSNTLPTSIAKADDNTADDKTSNVNKLNGISLRTKENSPEPQNDPRDRSPRQFRHPLPNLEKHQN